MNAPDLITELMDREGIDKIERYVAGRFSVVFRDGRIGVGVGVKEALKNARKDAA